MNKTVLGFGIGLVIIASGAVAYLAATGGETGQTAPAGIELAKEAPALSPATESAPGAKEEKVIPRIPQPAVVKKTELTLTRTIPDAANVLANEVIEVTVRVEQVAGNDPVRAMGMQEELPAGFVLEGFDGPRQPDVKPPAGSRGALEFAWFQFPENFFPAEFTYRLKKEGTITGAPQISGQALFRTSGEELRTNVVKSLLGTGAEAVAAAEPAPAEPEPAPEVMPVEAVAVAEAAMPAQVMLARGSQTPYYAPGEAIKIDVLLEHEGPAPVSAVAVVESIPPGWTFEGITGGTAPPIKPAQGTKGNLSFIFIEVPPFPIKFTYSLVPAADSSGEQSIKGRVAYRSENMPLEGVEIVTTIPPR